MIAPGSLDVGLKPAPPARKGTLLVVDDEEGPRQSLGVIFKDEYEVWMASEGAAAIELAQHRKIDVAVLDIRMAGMSGIELLERLKNVDPGIEVVMMTAFETTETMRQALRLRACDYINKPFDISTMRAAVANAMHRRSLESELRSNAEELQQLMAELQSHRIDEQLSKARREVYGSIIHDINGPLTIISGFIQLISQRIGDSTQLAAEDLQFIKERLKVITRQVTNCIEISRRYLSFLRRQTQEAPRVGVNQLLADLGQLLRVHPSLGANQLDVRPLARDVDVQIHGTDFIQILLNLAVNALQCASQAHRVEVQGRVLSEPLDLAPIQDGPQDRLLNADQFDNTAPLLAVSVRDTGPGIPPEILSRIFQAYFTTKEPRQGTGLGLNIVLRLVKTARGALHVHTELGVGTTFTLFLRAVSLPDKQVAVRN
ncbi:MAG: sensor histidine kinase [Limisphaerales bacterium]